MKKLRPQPDLAVPYEDVTGYLRLAQTLEHIVVSALDGAASTFPQSPRSASDSGAEAAGELSGAALVQTAVSDSSVSSL